MAKRRKNNPKQLPLLCNRCEGAVEIIQRGRHVLSRCLTCHAAAILLVIASDEPTDETALAEIEAMLLEQVSETANTLYAAIRDLYQKNGFIPSMRELQSAMGWTSINLVTHHLKALVEVGLIEREFASARAIKLRYVA